MADLNQAVEKNSVQLQDWRVWAEINYLDSPTEYREYLPNAPVQNPALRADFILLDTCELRLQGRRRIFPLIACLIIVLIAAYSVHAFMNLP